MAAGARHGQALRAAHDDVDAVVDDVRGAIEEATAERQEAERGEVPVALRVLDELVRGDLQAHELVIGQVLIEGVHHPVTIGVGVRVAAFFLEYVTLRVGVAGDVEPVAGPAFAKGRCGEQAVDELLGRLRVLVADIGGDLGGGRIIAPERECETADDDLARGLRIEVEAGGLQLGEDEAVERLVDLRGVGRREDGSGRRRHGLKRPVLARVVGDRLGFFRPRQPLADPLREGRDSLGRKLFVFAGHGIDIHRFDVVDRLDQPADLGLAGDDDRTDFAALEDELTRIEAESGLLFLLAVTFIAMIGQDRTDLLFEELQLRGRGGLGGGRRDSE